MVDDGVDDKNIVKNIAHQYLNEGVKIISNNGAGISDALNSAINVCNADYIARMDSDDIAVPDRIQKQVEYLNKNVNDIVACGTQVFLMGPNGIIFGSSKLPETNESIQKKITSTVCFIHPTIMFRRDVLSHNQYRRIFDGAEDVDLMIRLSVKYRVANLPESLLYYRIHPEQESYIDRGKKLALQELAFRSGILEKTTGENPVDNHNDLVDKFVEWRLGDLLYIKTRKALTKIRYCLYYIKSQNYKEALRFLLKGLLDIPKRPEAVAILFNLINYGARWKIEETSPFKELNIK